MRVLGVGAATSRRTGPSREKRKPPAWDTDQRRLPSCIERMGLKCVICGYVAKDREDLLRHRLADDHYLDDGIYWTTPVKQSRVVFGH